jgi:argininosuccinate lyase
LPLLDGNGNQGKRYFLFSNALSFLFLLLPFSLFLFTLVVVSFSFANSLKIDRRLFRQEIRASIAHCDGLFRAGIVTKIESERLKNGLWTILKRADFDRHYFEGLNAPDVFSFIEARLYQLINEAAHQLKIGRSFPHRVATALRLWLREETENILELLDNMLESLQTLKHKEVFAALMQSFMRDEKRFREVLHGINKMPAPSFNSVDEVIAELDFHLIARELDFEAVIEDSFDAAHDRDFCLDFSNACTTTALHLANLADAVIHQADSQSKRIFEIVLGKSAKIIGNHTALLTAVNNHSFTSANEQIEVCEIVFETTDILKSCLQVAAAINQA